MNRPFKINSWRAKYTDVHQKIISYPTLEKNCFRNIALKTKVFAEEPKIKHHSNAKKYLLMRSRINAPLKTKVFGEEPKVKHIPMLRSNDEKDNK